MKALVAEGSQLGAQAGVFVVGAAGRGTRKGCMRDFGRTSRKSHSKAESQCSLGGDNGDRDWCLGGLGKGEGHKGREVMMILVWARGVSSARVPDG